MRKNILVLQSKTRRVQQLQSLHDITTVTISNTIIITIIFIIIIMDYA